MLRNFEFSVAIMNGYNEVSVKKLQIFIQKADKLIDPKDTFWLSMQSNVETDAANVRKTFYTQRQKAIEDLKSKSFVVPSFTANMRNSSQISNIKFDTKGSVYKMNNEIEKLTSSVTGSTPILQHVNKEDIQQELTNLLNITFNRWDKNDENNTNAVVLFTKDSKIFDYNGIKKAFSKTKTTKQVNLFDPTNLSQIDRENNLRNFLNNNNQILVARQDLFTGCEASHIICLVDENRTSASGNNFMRCSLLRAVANLAVISAVDNYSVFSTNFDGFEFDEKYLKCVETLPANSWKCGSCNQIIICKSCTYFCHYQHQTTQESSAENKGKPCQCKVFNKCKF